MEFFNVNQWTNKYGEIVQGIREDQSGEGYVNVES
jgi:hypothetical protein